MKDGTVQAPPAAWFRQGSRVLALEAPAGGERRALLRSWLQDADADGARTWFLPCGFAGGGPWGGVRDLFAGYLEEMEDENSEILRRHDYELVRVLPHLRRSLGTTREGLTELSSDQEHVRNYPADRAFRLVHGLVDLFFELNLKTGKRNLVLACDDFDSAGTIGKRFFVELLRRSVHRLPLTLVIATEAGRSDEMLAQCPGDIPRLRLVPVLAATGERRATDGEREMAAREAEELEERVAAEPLEKEVHLVSLIRLWRLAGRPDRALPWLALGLEIYNLMGVYDDSVIYGEQALQILKEICPEDTRFHWKIVAKLFMSYLALKRSAEALRFFSAEAPLERYKPMQKAQICYSLAMVYARYLSDRDFARGEKLLAEGLEYLEQAEVSKEDYHFQYVFNRNGLAMIRQFQGRPEEAIALCRKGYALLQEHLPSDAHRLHRSVLVYNMAQVYAAMGATADAIEHYTAVIAMDPNYSEYYNERGNIYLRLGRLEEALADYQSAIAFSPPYSEVFTNLGQCYRKRGQVELAIEAYSRALDLQPGIVLAHLGRAQAYDEIGELGRAIADYSVALEVDPGLWEARLNRGILLYGEGRLSDCLSDLDAAIRQAPGMAQLYQNRAVVLADLGRTEEAIADLKEYLRSEPGPEDRAEAVKRLEDLTALPKPA
jgi:tetratricopeptide (TPR) repeat protein